MDGHVFTFSLENSTQVRVACSKAGKHNLPQLMSKTTSDDKFGGNVGITLGIGRPSSGSNSSLAS